jgi:hypothetical protein
MGSKDCKILEKTVRQILNELGIDSKITMSDDIDLFLKHKIDKTPALLIDDDLIHNQELSIKGFIRKHIIEHIDHNDINHKSS